jgi:2-iminobutanoate/2-iminopropanoate deaminase
MKSWNCSSPVGNGARE